MASQLREAFLSGYCDCCNEKKDVSLKEIETSEQHVPEVISLSDLINKNPDKNNVKEYNEKYDEIKRKHLSKTDNEKKPFLMDEIEKPTAMFKNIRRVFAPPIDQYPNGKY